MGRRPNLADLGLEAVGVKHDRTGVAVDDTMRTNTSSIYAVGDVVGGIMLAHLASRQGEVAAENITGHPTRVDYRAVPSCVFTMPEAASAACMPARPPPTTRTV